MNKLHTWKSLRLTTLLSSIFMVSLQLMAGKANAQQLAVYTGTVTGCAGGCTTTSNPAGHVTVSALSNSGLTISGPCGSGGYSGIINNGVTTYNSANGYVYMTLTADPGYVMNVTSITTRLRRSGSGIQSVTMAFDSSGFVLNDIGAKAPQNVGCGTNTATTVNSYNAAASHHVFPTNATSIKVRLYPYNPISSGGNLQIQDFIVNGSVAISGSVCPSVMHAGTITPTSTTVCRGTPEVLSLTGDSTGAAVTFKWYSATSLAGPYSLAGTGATYTAPNGTNGTTFYKAVATCSVSGTTDTTKTDSIKVQSPTVSAVTPANMVIAKGDSLTLTATSSDASVWTSSNTSVGDFTIDPYALPGVFVSSNVGASTVSLTATDGLGCTTTSSTTVYVVYKAGPCGKDLALYKGTGGNSTSVITVPNVTASTIAAHGSFGTTAPCTSGGISGLDNFVASSFSTSNPYISYVVTPAAGSGKVVNAYQYWVRSRSSGTGPTQGRLAYRYDLGTGFSSWIPESADHTMSTSGSCGANTNSWSWTPDSAVNGAIAIEIGFWPFAGAAGGTLQVNELEIVGCVGDSTACTSVTHATVTPSITHICGSGFYKTTSFTGTEGLLGLSYQWQASSTGAPGSFTNVGADDSIGQNNVYYTSKVQSGAMYYRIVTSCATASDTSNVDTLAIIPHPGGIAITGLSGAGYLAMGDSVSVFDSTLALGGIWEATHFSIVGFRDSSVNPAEMLGLLKGFTPFHYFFPGTIGCTVFDSVKVAAAHSLTAYTGKFGTSTTVENPFGATGFTFSGVTTGGTGFNAPVTPCSEGGISGLTVNTTVATYSTSGPRVCYTVKPSAGYSLDLTGFDATTRSSTHGPSQLTLAYTLDGGLNWFDNGAAAAENTFGCGISTLDQIFNFSSDVIVTDSIMVCVFPYAADNNTGSFQLNALDVQGTAICDTPTAIQVTDAGGGHGLDGSLYNPTCTLGGDFPLTSTPVGGTWSVIGGTGALTVTPTGPGTANLTLDDTSTGVKVVTVVYTSPCGVATTANVTVDESDANPCDGSRPAATAVADQAINGVAIYPNPTTNVLNIVAGEKVNVTVMSMDGRTLIHQDNALQVNVNKLASGVYMIQVYNQKNTLIKTTKFTKE